jgi:hypothetical protein
VVDASLPLLPPSLPALAWVLRSGPGGEQPFAQAVAAQMALAHLQLLVPAFAVKPATAAPPHRLPESAAHVVRHAADRLRRLSNAYGQWQEFDADAYFDLTPPQTALLVHMVERVRLVHVTFHVDLLLPAYQEAVRAWATQLIPAQSRLQSGDVEAVEVYEQAVAAMTLRWRAAVEQIQQTRRLLAGDIGYLAANGAEEERARWSGTAAVAGGAATILPPNTPLPTLTLTADFPLPLARQPGRLRRLHRHRDRNARRRRR